MYKVLNKLFSKGFTVASTNISNVKLIFQSLWRAFDGMFATIELVCLLQ